MIWGCEIKWLLLLCAIIKFVSSVKLWTRLENGDDRKWWFDNDEKWFSENHTSESTGTKWRTCFQNDDVDQHWRIYVNVHGCVFRACISSERHLETIFSGRDTDWSMLCNKPNEWFVLSQLALEAHHQSLETIGDALKLQIATQPTWWCCQTGFRNQFIRSRNELPVSPNFSQYMEH